MAVSDKDRDEAKTKIAKAIKEADNMGLSETEIRRVTEQAINALRG